MASPPLRYEGDYRVRFDEAGADATLRPSGYLRFAQDLAWRHSEAAGYDRAWYRQRGVHWLVRSVALEEAAAVPYGTLLHATTEVTGWRRVWARRLSRFWRAGETDAGETSAGESGAVASMTIDWVLLDEGGRPARVPDEIARFFAPGASFAPTRLRLPQAPPGAPTWQARVHSRDIDPMGHVNNAVYVDYLEEALRAAAGAEGGPGLPRTWQLEYLAPALPDRPLLAHCWPIEAGRAWRLWDSSAEPEELCRAIVRGARSGGG